MHVRRTLAHFQSKIYHAEHLSWVVGRYVETHNPVGFSKLLIDISSLCSQQLLLCCVQQKTQLCVQGMGDWSVFIRQWYVWRACIYRTFRQITNLDEVCFRFWLYLSTSNPTFGVYISESKYQANVIANTILSNLCIAKWYVWRANIPHNLCQTSTFDEVCFCPFLSLTSNSTFAVYFWDAKQRWTNYRKHYNVYNRHRSHEVFASIRR